MSLSSVADIMSEKIIDIHEDAPILEAFRIFAEHRISGMPVKNSAGQYVGILTKTDLVSERFAKMLEGKYDMSHVTVKELMKAGPLLSLKADQPIDDAIGMMMDHHVHRLFVVNESDDLLGVVSTFDIVRHTRFTFESYI